nr:IS3 family transposase [Kineosporia babensis]
MVRSTPGATVKGIAADLGIGRGALSKWMRERPAAPGVSGEQAAGQDAPAEPAGPAAGLAGRARGAGPASRMAQLEAQVARLEAEAARRDAADARREAEHAAEVEKLSTERDILRKATKYFASGDKLVNRFQFVEDHHQAFGVKRLCEVLEVKRSSFYEWRKAAPGRAARAASDQELAGRIRALHEADNTLGAPRMTTELNQGLPEQEWVNHKRVARIMRQERIAGLRLRRKTRTTISDDSGQTFPDLVKRRFSAPAPGCLYAGDITYLPLADGRNLYLATVIDLASRRLVGWAIADHMRADLVVAALDDALGTRGSLRGAIFHSDHGSQYLSKAFVKRCKDLGLRQSMGKVGSSADNAAVESFNATYKRETLQGEPFWPDEASCRRDAFRFCTRYSARRRHSYCGNLSPADYERTLKTATFVLAA